MKYNWGKICRNEVRSQTKRDDSLKPLCTGATVVEAPTRWRKWRSSSFGGLLLLTDSVEEDA